MIESKYCVDFHVHHSDETALTIIETAKTKNIKGLALIGKLEFSSYIRKYINEGEKMGIVVIPGVESPAISRNNDIFDLISIGSNPEAPSVSNIWLDNNRTKMNIELAQDEKLFFESVGFKFEGLIDKDLFLFNSIMQGFISTPGFRLCELITRNPINERKLLGYKLKEFELWNKTVEKYSRKPLFDNKQMLEAKFLYNYLFIENKPSFILGPRTSQKTFDLVHEAGGVVLYSPEGNFNLDSWKHLIKEGVNGIMAWHGGKLGLKSNGNTDIPIDIILDARKKGLLVLGGSDYTHWKNDWQMGIGREVCL